MARPSPTETRIRRILVALDASDHSLAALDAAAQLAGRLDAELFGLFVEDVNLLRLAMLPFAREFDSLSERALSGPGMEQSLKAQAQRVRRMLEAAANRSRVAWSFQVVRGQVVTEVLAHAPGADLIILGRRGRSVRHGAVLGSIARAVASQSSGTVMLLRHGTALAKPVVVLFDGSAAGTRALALGAQLAEQDDKHLVVLLPGAHAEALRAQARDSLAAHGMQASYRSLSANTVAAIVDAVQAEGGRLLVLVGAGAWASDSRMLDAVDCPVVLVR